MTLPRKAQPAKPEGQCESNAIILNWGKPLTRRHLKCLAGARTWLAQQEPGVPRSVGPQLDDPGADFDLDATGVAGGIDRVESSPASSCRAQGG